MRSPTTFQKVEKCKKVEFELKEKRRGRGRDKRILQETGSGAVKEAITCTGAQRITVCFPCLESSKSGGLICPYLLSGNQDPEKKQQMKQCELSIL